MSRDAFCRTEHRPRTLDGRGVRARHHWRRAHSRRHDRDGPLRCGDRSSAKSCTRTPSENAHSDGKGRATITAWRWRCALTATSRMQTQTEVPDAPPNPPDPREGPFRTPPIPPPLPTDEPQPTPVQDPPAEEAPKPPLTVAESVRLHPLCHNVSTGIPAVRQHRAAARFISGPDPSVFGVN